MPGMPASLYVCPSEHDHISPRVPVSPSEPNLEYHEVGVEVRVRVRLGLGVGIGGRYTLKPSVPAFCLSLRRLTSREAVHLAGLWSHGM